MAYTRQQARQVFAAKMRSLMLRDAKIKQEQDDADRLAWQNKQEKNAKLSGLLQTLSVGRQMGERVQSKYLKDTYTTDYGAVTSKYKYKDPVSIFKDPLETIKRYIDPKRELKYTPEYRQQVAGESIDPTFEEGSLFPADAVPGTEDEFMSASEYDKLVKQRKEQYGRQEMEGELAEYELETARATVDDPIAYERLEPQADDLLTPPITEPHIYSQAEMDELGNIRDTTVPAPATSPDYQEIQRQADLYTPTVPAPPDYEKIQSGADIAQEQQLQRLRDIETTPGVAPEVSADPELEKALKDLEELKAPKVKGADKVLPGQLRASVGMSDRPDVEALTVPDAKPEFGKTFKALQSVQQMHNLGKTLTNKDATEEEKAVATVQATKLASELALKHAKKEGTKLIAKGVGTATGGLLGGYQAVTGAKEAGEAWKEKDYDEAILHGMSSVSGAAQTAGAALMLSGVGVPLGAIMFGVGAAGSIISGVGLTLEGLFGGGDAPQAPQKPKFDYGRYFESIRRR